MVAQGSPVTIWCQGSLLADVYRLHKERSSVYWEAKAPQGSRNKARFHFEYTSSSGAGQYQCAYQSRNRSSERSDPLPLVVTGKTEGWVPGSLPWEPPHGQRSRVWAQEAPPLPAHAWGHWVEVPL